MPERLDQKKIKLNLISRRAILTSFKTNKSSSRHNSAYLRSQDTEVFKGALVYIRTSVQPGLHSETLA